MKHWLIIYDIRDPKRLVKVEKCVSSYGLRVQKSVFKSDAPDWAINNMKQELKKIIDCTKDFVLIFSVCEKDWQKQESYGIKNELFENGENYVIL